MNNYEIYLIDVAYFEKLLGVNSESKERPCLVILLKSIGKWVYYPITSKERESHYKIRDWKQAGLKKPSYIVKDIQRIVTDDLRNTMTYIGKLSEYDIQRLKSERFFEAAQKSNKLRESYSSIDKKSLLTEEIISNGKLEDFNPQELVDKAFNNRYATNSTREFQDKLLYINIDPGFMFGTRMEGSDIWVDIVEMDKNNSDQRRIYLEKFDTVDECVEALNLWKDEYIEGTL